MTSYRSYKELRTLFSHTSNDYQTWLKNSKNEQQPITSSNQPSQTANETHNPSHHPITFQKTISTNDSDDLFSGERLITPKPNNTTHLYFTNINGISPYHHYEQFQQVLENMNNIQADIICFAEHNLAVDQHKTRYELRNTIKRHLPNSRTVSATSNITFPTAYKPGGCLQIITNTIHGRITTQGSNWLGRWTYVGLATKASNMIFVITVYKPCKNNPNSGPLTVFKQQWTMLRHENKDSPDPRRQFDSDLIDFIEELQEKCHRIIIVGDFNETRNRSKLFQTLHSMGLKDMIYSCHNNIPQIRSCNKGNNVIDYALCSTSLLASIHASMYEPFMLNTPSDH